jgi:hypothetical protein
VAEASVFGSSSDKYKCRDFKPLVPREAFFSSSDVWNSAPFAIVVLCHKRRRYPPRRPARGARTWFRATLSCSSGRRFHQISFPSVRPARIELASSEWHSEAVPIDHDRMVGVPRIELGMHIGAGFTDPLSLQTWRHPIGCSGPNRTAYLVVMGHASCQCSTLGQKARGLNSLACAAVHPCVRRIGGQPRS